MQEYSPALRKIIAHITFITHATARTLPVEFKLLQGAMLCLYDFRSGSVPEIHLTCTQSLTKCTEPLNITFGVSLPR